MDAVRQIRHRGLESYDIEAVEDELEMRIGDLETFSTRLLLTEPGLNEVTRSLW